jgi:hypothetical protein
MLAPRVPVAAVVAAPAGRRWIRVLCVYAAMCLLVVIAWHAYRARYLHALYLYLWGVPWERCVRASQRKHTRESVHASFIRLFRLVRQDTHVPFHMMKHMSKIRRMIERGILDHAFLEQAFQCRISSDRVRRIESELQVLVL